MKKSIASSLLALLFMFSSCKHPTISNENSSSIHEESSLTIAQSEEKPSNTILGSKLKKPYSVSNVSKALTKNGDAAAAKILKANNLYVRFLPRNVAEYQELKSSGLILVDHPLDYEVKQHGYVYHDPTVPKDKITWQYAVVPVSYNFNKKFNYQVLEQLYLPTDKEGTLEAQALQLTQPADVVAKGIGIDPYIARGTILIFDDVLNQNVPLINANVRIKNWFHVEIVKTNNLGQFTSARVFRGKVDIKVILDNEQLDVRNIDLNLNASTEMPIGSEVMADSYNFTYTYTRNNPKEWGMAFIHNTVNEYVNVICPRDGITPPSRLRLWVFTKRDETPNNFSAPMLATNKSF